MIESVFSILGIVKSVKIAIIVFIVFAVFIYVSLTYVLGNLWLQAHLSGAPVTFAELIGMILRKVDRETIVVSRITAMKAGIELSTAQLESHYLAGGNVPDVVKAMIILKQAGIDSGWETLIKEDLLGRDVLGEAELTAEKIITNRSMLEVDKASETEYE